MESSSEGDDNDTDPSESSSSNTGNIGEREHSNVDGIRALGSANEHSFSVLRPITIGTSRSELLQFGLQNGKPENGNMA